MVRKSSGPANTIWLPIVVAIILIPVLGLSLFKVYEKQQLSDKTNTELNQQIEANNQTILTIQAEIDRLNKEYLRVANAKVRKDIADL